MDWLLYRGEPAVLVGAILMWRIENLFDTLKHKLELTKIRALGRTVAAVPKFWPVTVPLTAPFILT